MTFRIVALDPAPFANLFGLTDAALAAHGAERHVADAKPGYPCRVSLVDAEPGDTLLLVSHEHLPGPRPYRQRHAIFIREGAVQAMPAPGEIPESIARRLLSVRAYDAGGTMRDAEITNGDALTPLVARFFADPDVAFLHLHNARRGCFSAAVERVAPD